MGIRIPGLASGLDIDSIVKSTMKAYQTKIDQQTQKKDVLEIQQKQYRELIKQSNDFYNKYLNRGGKDCLLSSSNYASVKFDSGKDSAVTVTGLAGAKASNYDVQVVQIAQQANDTISKTELANAGSIDIVTKDGDMVSVDIMGLDPASKTYKTDVVTKIKTALNEAKITDLDVSYSDFSKGLVINTKDTGANQYFKVTLNNRDVAAVPEATIKLSDLTKATSITIAGNKVDFTNDDFTSNEKLKNAIKNAIMSGTAGTVDVNYDSDSASFKVTTSMDIEFDINKNDGTKSMYKAETGKTERVVEGKNCVAVISNSHDEVYTYNDSNNSVTLDNVNFKFSNVTDSPVKITGSNDGTDFKDKIVKFIDEYNTLITNLNKATMTKHNRNYSPLTADQKKEMSESEVKLWNEKVEEGQLYRDSDITRITDALKLSMSTVMEGSGLNLEKIGIKPVKDYSGDKNGTFVIEDEVALKEALENNPEDVMNLFIGGSNLNTYAGDNKTGVLNQLYYTINTEMVKSDSPLAKKVGFINTASFTNNTITTDINNYEKKIKDMQSSYLTKEQELYSKYASLETAMNKYNSQLSQISSYFGQQ